MIYQNFYLLIFKPFKHKTVCEVLQPLSMLLRSFQVESIILSMELSIFLVIAPEPVGQGFCLFFNLVCGGGPDAQGVDHRATTSWVSKPSLPYESVHPSCWRAAHFHSFIMCSRTSHSRPLALTQYDITVNAEYFSFLGSFSI